MRMYLSRRKIVTVLLLVLVVTMSLAVSSSTLDEGAYDWRDGQKDLALEGRGFVSDDPSYVRLPDRFKSVVTPAVWELSRTAIGFNARFVTDSDEIVVRWQVPENLTPGDALTYNLSAGVDIYRRTAMGAWCHHTVGAPNHATGRGELLVKWVPGEECLVYLPARAVVRNFTIGVRKGASFAPPKPHRLARPVVHYGTSIVNGACSSRPGLVLPALVSRKTDLDVIDLGFSGSGKMELRMADLVAEIDASLYIIDCEWNLDEALVKANYEPFVRRLKELRPDTPVLLCGACTENDFPRPTEILSAAIFVRLKGEDGVKWANWHYLSGVDMLPKDSDCTLDHCHPNDYGFARMSQVYAETVQKILGLDAKKVTQSFKGL